MLPGKGVGPLHIPATALGARARPPSRRFRRPRPCRFEAFHVFKIFVANPHKEGRVRNVLLRNQPKLLEFMASFQSERADEQFVEEKEFLINEIANLQPAPSEPAAASREASSEGDEAGR